MNKIRFENLPDLIDPQLAAEYLGMSVQFIYREVKRGHIPAKKLGNKIRIRKDDLGQLVN